MIWLADTILTIRSCRFSEECPSDESNWLMRLAVLRGRFWLVDALVLSSVDASDWLMRLCCPSQSSIGFSATRGQTCKTLDEENDYAKGVFLWWGLYDNTPFWPVLTSKQVQTNATLIITYSTRGGVMLLCTVLFCRELGKCSCRKGSTDKYL